MFGRPTPENNNDSAARQPTSPADTQEEIQISRATTPPRSDSDTTTNDSSAHSVRSRSWARELIEFALIVLLVVLPIRMFVAEPYIVTGVSMADTYATGHYLIINKFEHKLGSIERGDVLVFRSPVEEDKFYIKRVIGLPNETVSIRDGHVYITGTSSEEFMLEEPYTSSETYGTTRVELESEEYFMMGDNRLESFDSRSWGPLDSSAIRGEPMIRLFPFSKIDVMPGRYRQPITASSSTAITQ